MLVNEVCLTLKYCLAFCICRIHAEFQLNNPPFHPFWFTPGKFVGRLIISRDFKHVRYLNLKVPTDKKLNVGKNFSPHVSFTKFSILTS